MDRANAKILAVIPARSGSSRIPNKNIRRLADKPLIAYIIETAKKSKFIDKLILSTDDQQITDIGISFGIDIPFSRPDELSSAKAPLIMVNKHAYNYFKEKGENFDAVLSLQATSPFLKPQTIDEMVDLWRKSGCDAVAAIAKVTQAHPFITKRIDHELKITNFCPLDKDVIVGGSQKRETAYYLTGGAYLRSKSLLESDISEGHCLGRDSRGVLVSDMEAVDINEEIDFKFAEFILKEGILV
ncbi:MAG: acylneuraminate cytidylyltransferase family protein [Candidatus Omnitrophica bacterium]|nr:acylneuraminate cytidylyltransferase family protein [Candidatus Omnitrophota bacterium]